MTHETMIARDIAEKVTREAEKQNAKSVRLIEVEVGDLAFFDPVAIELWVRQALDERIRDGVEIKIEVAASRLKCAKCGFEGLPQIPEYHNHHMPLPPLNCPRCDSPDVEIEAKRDCLLKRIELEV